MKKPWVVLKYGGTSVSNRHNWNSILSRIRQCVADGETPIVVCSAVSGISNKLEQALTEALSNRHEEVLSEIRRIHEKLASELLVDVSILDEHLLEIERIVRGVNLIGEISPQTKAKIMSKGEIMSTLLGAEYLAGEGLRTAWADVRDVMLATPQKHASLSQQFLSAVCPFSPDDQAQKLFSGLNADVVVTQGFIARNTQNLTVLLGRGGSDTSAAYLAGKLGAQRLEIWTSVPGMFTANPHQVPSARILTTLSYEESQELASSGAKVLHPRCIEPAWHNNIPIHIRWTDRPEISGTIISAQSNSNAQIKALSTKAGIQVISMDSVGMWHESGFLANIFQIFKDHAVSIDQVSTSETNVTVTLDPSSNVLDERSLENLIDHLKTYCKPTRIGPCGSLTLVGKNIRSILHKMGNVLEAFEDKQIYLLTQAASDLNLTFTLPENEINRLLKTVHDLFFADVADLSQFGPKWTELNSQERFHSSKSTEPWWTTRSQELIQIAKTQSPVYVYDLKTVEKKADELLAMSTITRINYALKANSNQEILRCLAAKGLCFDAVSLPEIEHLMKSVPDLNPKRIVFTPNFAPISEYKKAFELGCYVNLDNLFPLEYHPEVFKHQSIMVRLDPGIAKGHHKHVHTAGYQSKFGIDLGEIEKLKDLVKKHSVNVIGLHAHVGSGIRSSETWAETALALAELSKDFPTVKILDLGGGFGVVEKPNQEPLNIHETDKMLSKFKTTWPDLELWIEPGRFLVAESGVLLSKVTQTKQKGPKMFVGVDAGMHNLIRPPLYGAYHQIVNLSKVNEPEAIVADIVGPICESGDVLGYGRKLPVCEENDVFLIATAGAYGKAMSSNYNLRGEINEIILQ